jgi:fatty-acyl-CoA synthase
MVGAKLVLPGPHLDGASVFHLIETHRVTITAGVPTVWLGLLGYMGEHSRRGFSSLKMLVIGGAAAPRSMIQAFER